jgi:type VI secretion system protein VasG
MNASVRTLDLALLQAGAGIKGEFENRLKSVISEVRASATPVILFIDEAHQLIGAGGAEGQGDAANILKPALARGELRTIAATTWAEYKKYVERDPALARRFQVVKVEEPTPEVAIDMLRGVVDTLQAHHGVEILDEAVKEAVRLSHRYISGRQLPDKAISVLDTACARVAIGQTGVPEEIEQIDRQVLTLEGELRLLRHAHATGKQQHLDIAPVQSELAELTRRRTALTQKLAEERQAVQEIIALRKNINQGLSDAAGDEESDAQSVSAQLQRLEKGLEAIQNDEPMVPVCVDSATVANVISGWTGIPVGKMMADEIHTILNLQENLRMRVVGQDQALDAIARRVRTFRADLDDPGKPVGVFMLVGPSGVGKTETAFALADMLYGGERNMITINLSEFQEAHSVSSLKGAPPGYVGYGKGGVLTEAVRRRPYSVVLLDEMEKAHPDVLEMFFQVFDKGTMEDGEGVSIDFKNTLILLTSNAAQDVITHACDGGRRPQVAELTERLRPELMRQFSPAFLGRVVLVPFYPLSDQQIRGIVELKLGKLARRFEGNHNASFTWSEAVVDVITARCNDVDSGARNIDFILTQTVLPELSSLVLERMSMAEPFTSVEMDVSALGEFEYWLTGSPTHGVQP